MTVIHYSDLCVERLNKAMAASWVAMDRKLAARRDNPEWGLRMILNSGIREDILNIRCCLKNRASWDSVVNMTFPEYEL